MSIRDAIIYDLNIDKSPRFCQIVKLKASSIIPGTVWIIPGTFSSHFMKFGEYHIEENFGDMTSHMTEIRQEEASSLLHEWLRVIIK